MARHTNKELSSILYSAKGKLRLFIYFPFLCLGLALLISFWLPPKTGFWGIFSILIFMAIVSHEMYAKKFLDEYAAQIREDEKKRLISEIHQKLGGNRGVTPWSIEFEKTLDEPVTDVLLQWYETRLLADLNEKEIYWSNFTQLNSLIGEELKEKGFYENPYKFLDKKLEDSF